jgi:hypothetical protein
MRNGLSKHGKVATAVAALFLCGCLQQISDLTGTISKTSQIITGNHQPGAGGGLAPMPRMSEAQLQQMRRQLSHKNTDRATFLAREEARPTLEKILTISACYPNFDVDRYLNPYTERGGHGAPMVHMEYHPKSQCLTLTRLDNWRMRAANAFSFRAVYISDASSESATREYEMVRQPDGVWLLR